MPRSNTTAPRTDEALSAPLTSRTFPAPFPFWPICSPLWKAYGIRVNTISAGPLKSRAATAISKAGPKPFIEVAIDYCKANAPLTKDLTSDDVGATAAFMVSPMSGAVTGVTM